MNKLMLLAAAILLALVGSVWISSGMVSPCAAVTQTAVSLSGARPVAAAHGEPGAAGPEATRGMPLPVRTCPGRAAMAKGAHRSAGGRAKT
jgi:hypothetical protein